MERRKFLTLSLATGAAIILGADWIFRSKPKEMSYGVETQVIIPGTFNYDVDSMRLSGDRETLADWITSSQVDPGYDPNKLRYGASDRNTDLFWNQISQNERMLIPENGTVLANLGNVDFEKIGLEQLLSAQYSTAGINGSDSNNQLTPGTVIAVRTAESYAKLRIDGYIPLKEAGKPENPNYNLKCTLVVYKQG